MENIFKSNLYKLLKKDKRLWNEETKEFNETLLKHLIDNLDEKIIELLLSDIKTKAKFFIQIKDVCVLKQNDLKFFIDENKLDNSYTQFQNEIGLRVGNKLLSDRDEVVLDWPFKDCVLEGGMTKEDQKRKEIFFNEVLAKDEIDRLEDPKALTNWKRYTKKGEEEVKEIKRDKDGTIRENLIIKGNNLLALYSLREQFAGKVKLIFIDPPYGREADTFYNDNFKNSSWLTYMRNRLIICRELLSDDGVIFVICDDAQQAYLKVLMDDEEVFSRNCFVDTLAVQMSIVQGQKVGAAKEGNIVKNTEFIHIYSKNGSKRIGKHPLYDITDYDSHYSIYLESSGSNQYKEIPLSQKVLQNEEIKKELITLGLLSEKDDMKLSNAKLKDAYIKSDKFRMFVHDNANNIARIHDLDLDENVLTEALPSNRVILYTSKKRTYLIGYDENGKIQQRITLADKIRISDDFRFEYGFTRIRGDWWQNFYLDMGNVEKEGSVKLKNGKKPERLLENIINFITDKDDVILDFFLGSGTTCAVAHKMGRQYIGIEQLTYDENDSIIRLNNVIQGDQTGISKFVKWQGGGDFVYFELAKWNEEARENILKAESLGELEKLFDKLYERYFLNYNVKTKVFRENTIKEDEFKELSLDKQKKLFIEMLDMNQLYVNFSERADKKYNLSQEDIDLTEEFYNIKK
jgi:adenine-specific DNA-methyltransferase